MLCKKVNALVLTSRQEILSYKQFFKCIFGEKEIEDSAFLIYQNRLFTQCHTRVLDESGASHLCLKGYQWLLLTCK